AGKCPPCAPIPADAIAWWRAENNALDSVAARHGTPQKGLSFAPGNVGQAFVLDGADDHITVPDHPTLNLQNFTIEAWIRTPTLLPAAQSGFIAAKSGSTGTVGYEL